MVAMNVKLVAQSIAGQAADEIEKVLQDTLTHGYGEVTLKIGVVDGKVSVIRVSGERTLKPSLN